MTKRFLILFTLLLSVILYSGCATRDQQQNEYENHDRAGLEF